MYILYMDRPAAPSLSWSWFQSWSWTSLPAPLWKWGRSLGHHLSLYVCMCAHVYACMHVGMYVCTYVCMHVCSRHRQTLECYTNRSSLVFAQTLEDNYKIFSCTCTLAQTLGATLKDLPSYLHRHLMLRYRMRRAGLGLGDHTIGG